MKKADTGQNVDWNAISRRAYELYQARGCQDGWAERDWLQAEAELTGKAPSIAGETLKTGIAKKATAPATRSTARENTRSASSR